MFAICNGCCIYLWHDVWREDIALGDLFPDLFLTVVDENAYIASFVEVDIYY